MACRQESIVGVALDVTEILKRLGGTGKVAFAASVSDNSIGQWRHRNKIPDGQLILLACRIERLGLPGVTRKTMFPDHWRMIWPELDPTSPESARQALPSLRPDPLACTSRHQPLLAKG